MSNFIENFWNENAHLWNGELVTRFPPEPNGFPHAGHAKSLAANHGMAAKFGGKMNLRMDDTNPEKESKVFEDAIKEMVEWLGFKWDGEVKYASDYFDKLHDLAKALIKEGSAYMDFTDRETMRANKGSLTSSGVRSPDAEKEPAWHFEMFERMKLGEFEEGACVLRAKIDMSSPNMNLRDPVIYRVKRIHHNRTGDKWCVYPAYSYAHPASDYFERISLSLCTLEFEDLRPFYDWVVEKCSKIMPDPLMKHVPVELEFARLELDRGMTSKRKINALVEEGRVDGWDDPRLVTLAGLRRRGFTPSAIRKFCEEAGLSKANATTPFMRMEDFLRLDLDESAPRRFVVARPIKLDVIDGPETYEVEASNHPKDESMGTRWVEFSSEMWIDAEDVRAAGKAEKGFKRVEPGAVLRIMPGFVLECLAVELSENGDPCKVVCKRSEGKPRATIHGLSRNSAKLMEIWEPDVIESEEDEPSSRLVVRHGYAEPGVMITKGTFHAVRYGYCVLDRNNNSRLILSTKLRSSI